MTTAKADQFDQLMGVADPSVKWLMTVGERGIGGETGAVQVRSEASKVADRP